jgi:NAD(P)-dependent dehydrogenase (short-subunit alcohol dehydrogenase family)
VGWREGGTVLVTGGSSGLGRAIAAAVAKGGGRPVVLDVNRPADDVEHVLVDLADGRAAEAAVERAVDGCELAAVVTAAGVDACGSLDAVAAEQWERVVRVNLLGTAAVIRAALPHLRAAGDGRIVTVASTLGFRALPDATAYCASKFGVVGFTRALAAELAGDVGVTMLVPGGMHTAFFDDRPEQYRPPDDARLNRPEDVAAAVVFALDQPPGCEVRELVVCPSTETSWP